MQDFSRGTFQSGSGGQGPGARGGDIGSHNTVTTTINNYGTDQVGDVFTNLKEELRPVFDAGILENKACLKGTRTGTLNRISEWIESPTGSRVFFLVGGAGMGKSAIAHRIGLQFQDHGRLGSFFSFNRSYQNSRNPTTLFRTIAYNLSEWNADFGKALATTIREHRSQINMSDITSQWKRLIIGPAKSLRDDIGMVLLVIDALDESGTQDSRRHLLSFLTDRAHELPSNFRILATSRPESDVMDAIHEHVPLESWTDLSDQKEEAVHDIDTYIRHRFKKARPKIPNSTDFYSYLVEQADGLFQWAFTACEWMLNSKMAGLTWKERLRRLSAPAGAAGAGLGALDALYSNILGQAFDSKDEEVMERFRSVMAQILSAAEPLSVKSLDKLRHVSNGSFDDDEIEDEISLIAPDLGALLIGVADDDVPVQPYHTSFRDFLTIPARSQEWYVNFDDGHTLMAFGCFRIMNRDLHFNLCNLPSSFLSNKQMLLAGQQNNVIPQPLKYACQYWIAHIGKAIDNMLWQQIKHWIEEKLLFWFEALSVLRLVGRAPSALATLADLLQVFLIKIDVQPGNIEDLLQDAIKFIQYFAFAIAESAPHIYISALAFAPKCSTLAQFYSDRFRNRVFLSKGQLQAWPVQQSLLAGHTGGISSVAFSSDGKHIVSGSTDKTIHIWNAETGQIVGEPLEGHTDTVFSAAFSPDARYIVSGSWDKTIQIWDVQTGQAIGQPLKGHMDSVRSVAFSPDGKYIVSGSFDKTIRIWDAVTGQIIGKPLKGHTDSVFSVVFAPNGKHIASGSLDKTIQIWDAEAGQIIGKPLKGHTDSVFSVAFSPDSKHIASGSADKTIQIWDAETGQSIGKPLEGHTDAVLSVAFSPNGKHIVSGSSDKTIQVWDAETGQVIGKPLKGHILWVYSVAFSPDGRQIVSGSWDETIRIWDAETGHIVEEPWEEVQGHTDSIFSVAFSPDAKHIVSGSADKTIQIWDAETGQIIGKPLKGHTDLVYSVAFSPDGKYIVSGSKDESIQIWDAETSQIIGKPLEGHTISVNSVAFSPNSRQIVSGSWDKTIRIWDAESGQLVGEPFEGHTNSVFSVAFSPDGKCVASSSLDKSIRIWDTETGQITGKPLEGHTGSVFAVAFSPDGKHIASGSEDKTICIWDIETGQIIGEPLEGHTAMVTSVAFSSDGRHIVSGSYDKTIRIWDTETCQIIGEPLKGHTELIHSVTFSPDNRHIVSGSQDKTIRLWDAEFQLLDSSLKISNLGKHYFHTSNVLLNKNGWVCGPKKELLLWIPPLHRLSLYLPRTIKIIGPHETILDFNSVIWGTIWTGCYTPQNESTVNIVPLARPMPKAVASGSGKRKAEQDPAKDSISESDGSNGSESGSSHPPTKKHRVK